MLNATQNLAARHVLQLKRVADAAGREYAAEVEKLQQWRREHFEPGVGYFRNPLGKIVLGAGAGAAHEEYPLRAHDIAGFHRLVRLSFEIRRQDVADDNIPAFIKRQPWAAHPVSGEAFAWDAAERELVMTPLARANQGRRFRVPVK